MPHLIYLASKRWSHGWVPTHVIMTQHTWTHKCTHCAMHLSVRRCSVHLVEPWIKLQSQCQTTTSVATKEPSWQLSPENPIVETELNFAFATGRAGVFLQLASFAFPHIWFICQISKLNCFDTRHNLNSTDTSMWRVWFPYNSKQSKSRWRFFGIVIVLNGLVNISTKTDLKMRLLKVNTKWVFIYEYIHYQAPKAYFLTMMGIYAFR